MFTRTRGRLALAIAGLLTVALTMVGCAKKTDTGTGSSATKWCSGVKLAAFAGGAQGSPFTNNVYNGYKAAEADLGPSVTYYFSDWNLQTFVSQFREAIALKPDGIAMMGHPGDDALDPLIEQAYAQGTAVTAVNVELPKALAKYSAQGTGYVGAPNYAAGERLAKETVKRSGAKAGDQAFVWGLKAQPGRGERTLGIIKGFEAAGLKVVYQEIDDATNKDAQAGTATFTGIMAKNPNIKIVVTDHGALTATAETYMKAAGKDAGSVYFAGFDLGPASVKAIKSGYLNLIIDQQPFLQGYLPVLQLCLTEKYGFSGLYVDTAGSFVDSSNVNAVEPLANKEIR